MAGSARRSVGASIVAAVMVLSACSGGHSSKPEHTTAGHANNGVGGVQRTSGPAPGSQTKPGTNDAAGAPGVATRSGDGVPPTGRFTQPMLASQDPQSTFGLDVDTASYTYAAAQINAGRLPAPAAVRPEEFINAFTQDYPAPAGDGFALSLDGSHLAATAAQPDTMRLLRVGLQTRPDDALEQPATDLTFVIDVSGSMGAPGKLDLVKDALSALVEQLPAGDSVAIVTFNAHSHIVVPTTSASQQERLLAAIDSLRAGGTTNLAAGLTTGYQVARAGFQTGATNRVVILSDGLPNTGETSSSAIAARVRVEADKEITLLGVGVGRTYGDALMEQLVDHADGFVVYVSSPAQAREAFITRLPATSSLRALDAKAQVTFNPQTVISYRLIGYDDRAIADSSFTNDRVDGGEVDAGQQVTALYAVKLQPDAYGMVASAAVRWLDPATHLPDESVDSVYTTDLDVAFDDAAPGLRVCYAAAYFAEALRGSPYGSYAQLPDLASIAWNAADASEDPAVAALADTISRAADLIGRS
jgi:Ca-activated chloride channel family protein